ncbi:MAG: carbon monoxide dehydrogenase subunit G [Burkholderiales bacterium]|nr:carbon monoxide dehydrogenase subunit G [Burkholderiales bacterium]
MNFSGVKEIEAPVSVAWQSLNNPALLKDCINGCTRFEEKAPTEYDVEMNAGIGPIKAKFRGEVKFRDIQPPTSYQIHASAQGLAGIGSGSGEISVSLEAIDDQRCRLVYQAQSQVGGKIAQLGSRLVEGVANRMIDDFFKKFSALHAADKNA